MTSRNISAIDRNPVIEIKAETPEDSQTLRYFYVNLNQGRKIESTKAVSSGASLQSLQLSIGTPVPPMRLRDKLRLCIAILFSDSPK